MKLFRPAELGMGIRLASVASYLPARVVTNEDLVALGTPMTAQEMARACGITERRYADASQATSDLATEAASRALAAARTATVDRVIVATVSPDHASPSTACFVQRNLKLGKAPAFDVTASCSGFLYALDVAARAVATGDTQVLAVAADIRSRFVNPLDRSTAPLFGDGACAAVVSRGEPGRGLLSLGLLADGSGVHSVYVPAGGSREPASEQTVKERRHSIRMEEGPQVYLTAVEGMLDTGDALLRAEGLSWKDIRWVVPHQPNQRILERMTRLARLEEGQLVFNIEKVGNISGASCGVALHALLRSGKASEGDRVLLLAAGAGYTAGAALLQLDDALLSSGIADDARP